MRHTVYAYGTYTVNMYTMYDGFGPFISWVGPSLLWLCLKMRESIRMNGSIQNQSWNLYVSMSMYWTTSLGIHSIWAHYHDSILKQTAWH